jgi:hypothetical protein
LFGDDRVRAMSDPAWSYRPGLEPAAFPHSGWGHRGYEATAVDSFVDQVIKDRDAAAEQISDLRAEVDRLHRYIRRQWAAVAAAESAGAKQSGRPIDPNGLVSPAAQARAVLGQAQEIAERRLAQADARLSEAERLAADRLDHADRQIHLRLVNADREVARVLGAGADEAAQRLTRVDAMAEQVLCEARQKATDRCAQAEDDADQLLLLARTRYEDIVVRAHHRADQAAEVALAEIEQPATGTADGRRIRAELEMKAAYLRTFAKFSRAALQAALDVTAREFDRLLGASASRESVPVAPETASEPPLEPALQSALEPTLEPKGPAAVAGASVIGPPRRADSGVHAASRVIVLPDTEAAQGLLQL